MLSERNKKRLNKKAEEKEQKGIIEGMTMLQRYVLNGLKMRKISHDELIEMSVFYVVSELEKTLSADPHSNTEDTIREVKQLIKENQNVD